jgi:hypothetical protein
MKKKKKRSVPTVTLGEALAVPDITLNVETTTFTAGILTVRMKCDDCNHEATMHIPPGSDITCPKCFDSFVRRNVPKMRELPPEPPPPGPPAPKPKLHGGKRYAKVVHEPLNPRFCFIKFEDDGTEGKLWKHVSTPTLRHIQLIVERNRDEQQGGWTIVRETPHL